MYSHCSSRMGKNVTELVICFIISLISPCTSFSVLGLPFLAVGALGAPGVGAVSSVWISNCQRSKVSSVSADLMARTRRVRLEERSHSGVSDRGCTHLRPAA